MDQLRVPKPNNRKKTSQPAKQWLLRLRKAERETVKHTRKFLVRRFERLSRVRRQIFGWIMLVSLLIAISILQWSVFRSAYSTDIPVSGGTYSEGVLGPLDSLNPIFARSNAEKSAARLLFASLYSYDSTGNLKSELAESIQVDQAEQEYTVTLRDDLKWSDGQVLDADDVVFTISLLQNPDTKAEISGWSEVRVEKINKLQVKLMLPAPFTPFMHALTFPVLPGHILSAVSPSDIRGHSFSDNPVVSSGPFQLSLLQSVGSTNDKKVVHLAANQHYFRGQARLDRFHLYTYGDRQAITRGLTTSEIIATPELTRQNLSENLQQRFPGSESFTVNDGVYALFNNTGEILQSHKVRQALALAVDKGSIAEKVPGGSASLSGPVLSRFTDDSFALPAARDLELARRLLDEDGWLSTGGGIRKKDGRDLVLSLVTPKGADYEAVAEGLAKMWQKELAIKVDFSAIESKGTDQNIFQTVLRPRNFDILVYELELGGDPDSFAYWHSSQATPSGLNFANYSNAIADDALSSGRTISSPKLRTDRYRAFAKRWHADTPAVALYQPKIEYISKQGVVSIDPDSELVSPTDRFADVIYWSVRQGTVYKTP